MPVPAAECLKDYPKKWLLKPHLVEPVVTAVIQNRIDDFDTLSFAAALLSECKLQDHVYVSQIQALLAARRLRTVLQPGHVARRALVNLFHAFDVRSPGLLAKLNALPLLLPYYQATLDDADRGLLQLFRRAELEGSASLHSLIRNWTPWRLRGVCTGPFQVLANLDPELLHRAQTHVLKTKGAKKSKDSRLETADSLFYLGLMSSLLETEELTRSNWLALVSSNALGLAICSLASTHRTYVIAGDRILARARNALQVGGCVICATSFRC